MSRPSYSAILLAAGAVLFAGCDEATAPKSELSTLTVQAYVDANGNGSLDSADDPLAGATVSLTSQAGNAGSATIGADGTASISGLEPGTYTLSISGASATGAELATASNPVIVAEFYGSQITAEFRYVYNPGGVTGVVYRDDNESGAFEDGEDLVAPGLAVTIYAGSSMAADPLETAMTDAGGAYSFAGLRPGTYTLAFEPFETIEFPDGDTRVVEVAAEANTVLDVEFTGSLLVDIDEARASADGKTVTVQGIITWHPEWDNRVYFLQDETGGITAFDADRKNVGQVGDLIQMTGQKGTRYGEIQISPVAVIELLGSPGAPDPRPVTGTDINAGLYQGELVTLDAKVTGIEVLSFGNQMVTLQDGGGVTFTVYADSRTGVEEDAWAVGSTYSVTGVLAIDDRNDLPNRLEVRGLEDVVAGGSAISIAEARALLGEDVIVEGVVTWQNQWDTRVYFLQDETGGFSTFHSGAPELQMGDRVQVRGTVAAFRGELQLSPVSAVTILSHEAVPAPRPVTAAEINAGLYQGELVTVTGVATTVTVLSFDNQAVTLTDGLGADLAIYVDSRNGTGSDVWTEGNTYRVTGVMGTDDRQDLPYRIEPRMPEDIVETTAGVISMAEARAMAGEVATVEGVVTWQTEWDGRVYFFQDATGGISTFHSGAPDDLAEGERIRVTGEVSAFRGEVQLGSISAIERLGVGDPATPKTVTGAQVNAGQFQGELVTVRAEVVEVAELSFGNQAVTLKDALGTAFSVYGDSRTSVVVDTWPAVGEMVDVTGVLGTDDRNDLPHRIEVRRPADVAAVAPAAEGGDR